MLLKEVILSQLVAAKGSFLFLVNPSNKNFEQHHLFRKLYQLKTMYFIYACYSESDLSCCCHAS
jgi:hypothetical protein